ncbi:MAG TPA: PAS domain S-box protein [Methylomirabilota bacterium]|nr:PAS domain S-box protein [Methylomirabilota bacterium]
MTAPSAQPGLQATADREVDDTAPAWRRYGLAVASVGLAWAFTLAAPPLHKLPTALFFAAVTLTAFYGHLGPGLLATALSTAALDYSFMAPVRGLSDGLEETVRIAAFALAAALINSLHERRRLAELARRMSEARERIILETAIDGIITVNHEGRVLDWNPAAEQLFGYSRAGALGRDLADLIVPPGLRGRHRHGLARFARTGHGALGGKRIEITAMRADGREFPVELAIARVPLDGPAIFRGFVRDITERRQAQDAERREEALRSVTRLANAAAHEINNPLAVIMVDLDLLSHQCAGNSRAQGRIARAREAVRRIEDIVGRMAHITRLEVMPQPTDLPEILDLFKSTSEPESSTPEREADRR